MAREFEAALAWWRAAGVDCDFVDDATAWLSKPRKVESQGSPAERAAGSTAVLVPCDIVAGSAAPLLPDTAEPATLMRRDWLGESPPANLDAFHGWWIETLDLAQSRSFPRVLPRGPRGAKLMVLVPQPEMNDTGILLSGPQGRLLANILAAMGLDESEVYIASALPAHTPMADLPALAAGGMDAVTALHITLAQPQRLLLLGIPLEPMLAPLAPPDETPLRGINYNGANTPVMVSEALDAMLDMPPLKTRFWKRWIEWSAA
ncbi:uracil-DNA glycosylase family protein [Porphyrobacter sp. LM 6]|uniref:uracil-DNA glycosylase family protein n=1 Tax=Porphyrobacter sp. LM 6 TaxID=1896196 RepID=UPI000863BAF3|nr:uracil-DNA glycosylase family protein [Porphyrobacter sp. LM 6]AOL94996.1 DNA polymerase [Porphyrobacter sp. LM 6]